MTAKKAVILKRADEPTDPVVVIATGDAAPMMALTTQINAYEAGGDPLSAALSAGFFAIECVAIMEPVEPGDTLILETGLYKHTA